MYAERKLWIGQSEDQNIYLLPEMANRHGLIAGATGTGKTVTMKVLAESFSDLGVPVFMADVKGDVSGMCQPGADSENMQSRIARFGIEGFRYTAYPTRFWDIFGEQGHPVRVTVSDMGPILLSRLFDLTDAQSGAMNIVFRIADDLGLLLLDLKDLRMMLSYVASNRVELSTTYGNIASATIGVIQRKILEFEDEGGELMFGEPMLDILDWIRTDRDGRGYINILSSTRLIQSPKVYATFLLWMLTELFEKLPEVGDLDKPRMVFFFDEAHLLFTDMPKALLQKIVQVVKLIRSKGVGVYFVSQNPTDIPDEVLAQLSNRIQHALRAYTPAEQKTIRATATAFRVNPAFDTQTALMELGVGEALISCLDEKGVPGMVQRCAILPPQSFMGQADANRMQSLIAADEFDLKYRQAIDRESAYEILTQAEAELEEQERIAAEEAAAEKQRLKEEAEAEKQRQKEEAAAEKAAAKEAEAARKAEEKAAAAAEKEAAKAAAAEEKAAAKAAAAAEKEAAKAAAAKKKVAERAATNAANSVARSVSTNMINSVLGGKTASTGTIAKRAASSALSSVMRSGSTAIVRGLFGTKK